MPAPEILKPTTICPETWRPILWREWQRNQRIVGQIIFSFVLFFFIVPLDPNGMMLLFAILIAGQLLAVIYGGGDVAEGSERYAFILPPRRVDYFWARYLMGFSILLTLTGIAYALSKWDLHRHFWGLFCESGLAAPRRTIYPEPPLGNYILFALFAYSNSYCFAASARRTSALVGSWFMGLLVTFVPASIVLLIISILKETEFSRSLTEAPFVLLSLFTTVVMLYAISRAYVGKGANADTAHSAPSISFWKIVGMIILIIYILLFLLNA